MVSFKDIKGIGRIKRGIGIMVRQQKELALNNGKMTVLGINPIYGGKIKF